MLIADHNKIISLYSHFLEATKPKSDFNYRHWITLLKPRVLALVVYTGMCGIFLAPGHLNVLLGVVSILCISTASGACGAINMWFDRDIDMIMRRTCNRPLPAGELSPGQVLIFGLILALGSVLLMGLALNAYAACVLALSIVFYLVIYTIWLKRRTSQNIVIGGAAGAFPPVIGWISVSGSLDFMPLLMFLIVFVWTPSHFWCLALWVKDDYAEADVPMLPIIAGSLYTKQKIKLYANALIVVSEVPAIIGLTGILYGLVAAVLGLRYIILVHRVLNDQQDSQGKSLSGDGPAKSAFKYSIWYLFLLFGVLVVDYLVN